MLTIDNRIFSHLDFDEDWENRSTPKSVSESEGLRVGGYRQLLDFVSSINYENPRFDILYRGQGEDYLMKRRRSSTEPRSSIYPSIFRVPNDHKTMLRKERERRFDELDRLSNRLVKEYPFDGRARIRSFEEVQWAILQHYQVVYTPLVDVTDSLLAAASFAYLGRKNGSGYLYAFGVPHQQGSISYHADDRLVVVRLASACPPEARRAHYQQAYFVGRFTQNGKRSFGDNLAVRMVAKFRLVFSNFWTDGFSPLPKNFLFPKKDPMRDLLESF